MWRLRLIDEELYQEILDIEAAALEAKKILIDQRDHERAEIVFHRKFTGMLDSEATVMVKISDVLEDVGLVKMKLLRNGSKEARRIFKGQFPDIEFPKKKAHE